MASSYVPCCVLLVVVIVIVAGGGDAVDGAALQAVSLRNALHPGFESHPLMIKSYPAVENYQSDLYEVYAEPYTYVSIVKRTFMGGYQSFHQSVLTFFW